MGDGAGGDAACWLDRVCPRCGRFVERDAPADCPHAEASAAGARDDRMPPAPDDRAPSAPDGARQGS